MKFEEYLESLTESTNYKDGDVVKLASHTKGTVSGTPDTYNIEKVTPTQIHVFDKNTKGILKFNKKTLRGIGDNDHLMIVADE